MPSIRKGSRKADSRFVLSHLVGRRETSEAQVSLKRRVRLVRGGTCTLDEFLGGVPIEQISILLGHSSLKVTEEHYAP